MKCKSGAEFFKPTTKEVEIHWLRFTLLQYCSFRGKGQNYEFHNVKNQK
jgi:hypothetical protein